MLTVKLKSYVPAALPEGMVILRGLLPSVAFETGVKPLNAVVPVVRLYKVGLPVVAAQSYFAARHFGHGLFARSEVAD